MLSETEIINPGLDSLNCVWFDQRLTCSSKELTDAATRAQCWDMRHAMHMQG